MLIEADYRLFVSNHMLFNFKQALLEDQYFLEWEDLKRCLWPYSQAFLDSTKSGACDLEPPSFLIFKTRMRSVCCSWKTTESQGSICFVSMLYLAWIFQALVASLVGHCDPLLICHVECSTSSTACRKTDTVFFTHIADVSNSSYNNREDRKANPCSKKRDFSNQTFIVKQVSS